MKLKKIYIILVSLVLVQPLFASKTVDNVQIEFVQTLLNRVLIEDSVTAQANLQHLEQSLESFKLFSNLQNLQQIQSEFKELVKSWKAVETVYIAGALDEDFQDHPRFIDFFHQTNESILNLLFRAVNSETTLQQALFKNSTKSINALEYLLFYEADDTSLLADMQARDHRRTQAALLIVQNIQILLDEIVELYRSDKKLLSDSSNAISLVVNALIDSSYKLANWRVGEAGGLVAKYQGKPSTKQLEYPSSSSSVIAIKSILQTHRKIVDQPGEQDLLAIARAKNVETELLFLRDKIDQALEALENIPQPLANHLESKQYRQLHQRLTQLHDAYYFMLIDALNLDAKIIDADGD